MLDGQLSNELRALPIYDPGFLTYCQWVVTAAAADGRSLANTRPLLSLETDKSVGVHRSNANKKMGATSITRVVYSCLDSRLIDYQPKPEPVELTPAGAIALKGVFLGYNGLKIAERMPGMDRKEVRGELRIVRDALEATNDPHAVLRAYEIGLCVPSLRLPNEEPAPPGGTS